MQDLYQHEDFEGWQNRSASQHLLPGQEKPRYYPKERAREGKTGEGSKVLKEPAVTLNGFVAKLLLLSDAGVCLTHVSPVG